MSGLEAAIRAATDGILAQQMPDGHWVYELEADATIPAEYVLLVHYLAETPNLELKAPRSVSICAVSRAIRMVAGRFITKSAFDISATVKAYFALKMITAMTSTRPTWSAPAARSAPARGGAIKTNVFTRILLCLYGETSWANVPTVPPELICCRAGFPFICQK